VWRDKSVIERLDQFVEVDAFQVQQPVVCAEILDRKFHPGAIGAIARAGVYRQEKPRFRTHARRQRRRLDRTAVRHRNHWLTQFP
jgi:hypothetical protein